MSLDENRFIGSVLAQNNINFSGCPENQKVRKMNMKCNMALAALVVAGITAWLTGFVSQQAVHSETLAKDAVTIEAAASAPVAGGAAKVEMPEPILGMLSLIHI